MEIKEIALRLLVEEFPGMRQENQAFMADFAEALIESYKAELLKEVGEPVSYLHKEFSWKNRQSECVVKITLKAQPEYGFTTPLYTSDQLAAAILKATKPLEEEIDRLKAVAEADHMLNQVSIERIMELERQLAKAEQRVSEAIIKFVEVQRNDIPATGIEFANAIRSGEWRKFVKEM